MTGVQTCALPICGVLYPSPIWFLGVCLSFLVLPGSWVWRHVETHLAFGHQLLPVAVGGVSGDLAGPQGQAHHEVGTSHHQQGQHVDQDHHTHVVPGGRMDRITHNGVPGEGGGKERDGRWGSGAGLKPSSHPLLYVTDENLCANAQVSEISLCQNPKSSQGRKFFKLSTVMQMKAL